MTPSNSERLLPGDAASGLTARRHQAFPSLSEEEITSGSVKRVGGAIGEGAAAVALIHQHLAALPTARVTR
jgi:thioredoxin reductase (NADPH)